MNQIVHPADQEAIIHAANAMYVLYGDIFRALPGPAHAELTGTAAV